MHEFRPADVLVADAALAGSLRERDPEALARLVARYGGAVTGLASQLCGDPTRGRAIAQAVFARAWATSVEIDAEVEFAPWLASITAELAGGAELAAGVEPVAIDDIDRLWAVAAATASVPTELVAVLRAHYVDGRPADGPEGARERLRVERRLGHLGEVEVTAALADPNAWVRPDPDLAATVLGPVLGSTPGRELAPEPLPSDSDASQSEPRSDTAHPSHDRRRSSGRAALVGFVAAGAALLAGIALFSAASGSPQPVAFTAELIATGVVVEAVGGEISVTERAAGLEIELDAPTLPTRSAGSFYEGVLLLESGDELTVGTFSEGESVTLWGGIDLDRVTAFRVVLGDVGRPRDVPADPAVIVLRADFPQR